MKKVWTWIRSNLLVVIFSVVILIVLPVSYFVSSGWNTSIREKRQSAVKADYDNLTSQKVVYRVPSLRPGETAYEYSGAPNAEITQRFAELKKAVEAQAGGVVTAAEELNSRNHLGPDGKPHVLVDGLLPSSSGPDFQSKARLLAERLVGTSSEPSVYKALFDRINAGDPLSGPDMPIRLADARQREVDQIIGTQAQRNLTPDEEAKITKILVEKRKSLTQSGARRMSVYGGPSALLGFVPATPPNEAPPIKRCFQWQADYWLVEDLLAAVKLANTGPDGQLLPVTESVVKRIEKITPKGSPLGASAVEQQQTSSGHEGGEAVEAPAAASPTAQVVPDFTASITGRWSGPGNAVYDVRRVEMVLVVSSKNLPKFFDAVSRANFMTVTDCDLFDVDLWADLEQGFYYGEESVVRARVEIETVWLRSWTTALMPKSLKEELGIAAEPVTPAEGEKKEPGQG